MASVAGEDVPVDRKLHCERLMAELRRLMLSTHFAQSKRAQNFLRYVVSETVAGRECDLKERTIGAVVFHKALDYDTGNNSVVRVAANDVRKRIAQHYQDESAKSEWMIDLPPGTYVPILRPAMPDLRQSVAAPPPSSQDDVFCNAEAPVSSLLPVPASLRGNSTAQRRRNPQLLRWSCGGLATLIVLATLGRSVYANRNSGPGGGYPNPVWQSFESANSAFFAIGYHNLISPNGANDKPTAPTAGPSISQLNSYVASVPLSDAIAVASLSDFMGRHNITYRIVSSKDVSLARLRHHPVVLLGGLDNVWTINITRDMPFSFASTRLSDDRLHLGLIKEAEGLRRSWQLDFTSPSAEWKKDYAIVSQFRSSETEMPVVIIAGIGSAGTLCAMEFLTNPKYIAELEGGGVSRDKPNFEAVLSTNVIDGDSGPPHLEALRTW